MRIAFLTTRFDETGGAQVHVHDLAIALDASGHEVTVITGAAGALTGSLERHKVQVVYIPELERAIRPRRDLAAVRATLTVLRKVAPDLISCHSSKAGVIGRIAAARAGVPALFTAHGWAFTQGVPGISRLLYAAVEAALVPLSAAIIAVSANDMALGRRWLPHARTRLRLVRNAVHDVDPSLRANPGTEPPVGTFIGRLDRQKDHGLLLKAMTRVPGAHIQLVGDGPRIGDIRRAVEELDLADRVLIHGECDDVPMLLATSQYFVLLSLWEGLPRSIIEAMRAGLPVLASDVGGVGELVEPGATGYLVPRSDVDAVVAALELLISDRGRRLEMGHAARDRYESQFSFDRMLDETMAVYSAVLEGLEA